MNLVRDLETTEEQKQVVIISPGYPNNFWSYVYVETCLTKGKHIRTWS